MVYGVLTKLEDVTDVHVTGPGKIKIGALRIGAIINYPKVGEFALIGSLLTTKVTQILEKSEYHCVFTTENSKYILNTDTEMLQFLTNSEVAVRDLMIAPIIDIEQRLSHLGYAHEDFNQNGNSGEVFHQSFNLKGGSKSFPKKLLLKGSIYFGGFQLTKV